MSAVRVPPHQRHTLGNGLQLVLLPRHDVPLIAFEAVVRGGGRLDPPQRAGVAAVTAELLTRGAGARDAYGFADAVEGLGGVLDGDARSEAVTLHGQCLARDCEQMLALLSDALLRPHFAAVELDKVRERRIEFIRAAKDSDPQSLLSTYGRAFLFGSHPYGRPVEGSERSLAAITRDDVQRFYAEQFGADRATLVVAGDFDPQWMRVAVESALACWPVAAAPLPALRPAPRRRGRRVWLIDAPGATQSYFWLANVGVAQHDPSRAALEVANTALGGSFGSLLMQSLRVQHGLTYSIGSSFRRGSVAAEFAISSFTEAASTLEAFELTLEVLQSFKRTAVDDAAIQSARNYLLGQYPLGYETAADWASALADLELYGLSKRHIDEFGPALARVDAAQVRTVIDTAFPAAGDLDVVLIGDAETLRKPLAALGTIHETALEAPDFLAPREGGGEVIERQGLAVM